MITPSAPDSPMNDDMTRGATKLAARRYLSALLIGCMVLSTDFPPAASSALAQTAANANEQALDKLLAPIALYPDPLLAQVLACATSPEQVTEVQKWLQENKSLQGTPLQEAATTKGFDASFTAIVLFPDVLDTMAKNLPWTTELGKAFLSDQQAVLDSVQRLRKQAQTVGNLKTTEQQQVKTETQEGTQVIVIQPANPQVVYVPVYNTTTVYTSPPPKDDSGEKAAAALIGFAAGIAIGAAMSDNYYGAPYGWGAWGVGWHSHTVVVAGGGAWRVPPGGRYPYTRPVPRGSYRAPVNINAPTYNVNVDRSNNVNGNRPQSKDTPRPTQGTARPSTQPATQPAARPSTQPATQPAARPATSDTRAARPTAAPSTTQSNTKLGSSGAGGASSGGAALSQSRAGTKSSALSGYQSGGSERAAQSRGQRSVSGGGARSRAR
jgi:hypothetical protein